MTIAKLDTLGTRESFLEKRAVEKINEVVDQVNVPKKDELTISFVEGNMADATGAIKVTIRDQDGDPVDATVVFWGSATALGAATGSSIGDLSVGTDGELVAEITEHIVYMAVTDDGDLDIVITGATAAKFLNVAVGSSVVSHEFTVAA
jgi:hypothetical protein